jgi:hypothetical protein
MAKQLINLGVADKGNGDPLRTAFNKVNSNFNELYTLTGGTAADLKELAQDYAAEMFTNGTHSGLSATYNDTLNTLNLVLDLNIDGGDANTEFDIADFLVDGGGA